MGIRISRFHTFHHLLSWKISDYYHLYQAIFSRVLLPPIQSFSPLRPILGPINDYIDQNAYEPAGADTLLADDDDGKAGAEEFFASAESQKLRIRS